MSKTRDTSLPQHHYDQGHYGELPLNALPAGDRDNETLVASGSTYITEYPVDTREDGSHEGRVYSLNFTGPGVTVNVASGIATITVASGGAGGSPLTVQDMGLDDVVNNVTTLSFYEFEFDVVDAGGGEAQVFLHADLYDRFPRVMVTPDDAGFGDYLIHKLSGTAGVTAYLYENGSGFQYLVLSGTAGGPGTDELVKVSSNDTTGNYLLNKLVAGANITLTENNNGGNESITITAASGSVRGGSIGVSLYHSTTQSVNSSTDTKLEFNTEHFDTHGFHSTVSNTTRITIPSGLAGKYLIGGSVIWDGNTTGTRFLGIRKNGAAIPGANAKGQPPTPGLVQNTHIFIDLAVNDYIELNVWQDSGGSRTVGSANDWERHGFWAVLLSTGLSEVNQSLLVIGDPPSFTNTADKDFRGASNLGPYTAVGTSAGTVNLFETNTSANKYELTNYGLLVQVGHSQTASFRSDYTLPDGKSMVLAVQPFRVSAGDNAKVALVLNDTDTGPIDGEFFEVMLEQDATEWVIQSNRQGDTAGIEFTQQEYEIPHLLLFRIARSGTDYSAWVSQDGGGWAFVYQGSEGVAFNNVWITAAGSSSGQTYMPVARFAFIVEGEGLGSYDPWEGIAGLIGKVRISNNDSTPNYMVNKLSGTAGVTLYEYNNGGDEILVISGSNWNTYSPAWTSTGTAPSIGNGTLTGRWKYLDNDAVAIQIRLTWGSTTSAGTGDYNFGLPVSAAFEQVLSAVILDSGTDWKLAVATTANGASNSVRVIPEGANLMSGTSPMTWASGDKLIITGIIEI